MKEQIIIHTGMHKTASTYLQNEIFPELEDILFIKFKNPGFDNPLSELIHKIILTNPLFIDIEQEKKSVKDYIKKIEQQKVLISSETLFGMLFEKYRDNVANAEILKTIFPDAKIFFVFRRQDIWLESIYRMVVKNGTHVKINDFLNYKNESFYETNHHFFKLNDIDIFNFDWGVYLENYIKLFGKENVLALPYEMLKENPNEFLSKFYDFSEIKPFYPKKIKYKNKGLSFLSIYFLRFLNSFLNLKPHIYIKSLLRYSLGKFVYIDRNFIDDNKRQKILEFYKDKNKDLSEMINIDLSQYGYF